MKKGEIYEGKVTEVNFPNKGKVECENGTVTVKNVIPGQNIRFMINKKRSGKYEGRISFTIVCSRYLRKLNTYLENVFPFLHLIISLPNKGAYSSNT